MELPAPNKLKKWLVSSPFFKWLCKDKSILVLIWFLRLDLSLTKQSECIVLREPCSCRRLFVVLRVSLFNFGSALFAAKSKPILPYLAQLFDKQTQITKWANQDTRQKACNRCKARENAPKRGHDWFNLVLLYHHFDWLKKQYICTDLLRYAIPTPFYGHFGF